MSAQLLALTLDFAVLLALGGAIFYTVRLSRNLKNFQAHREELRSIIQELSRNVDEAQRAIEGLKKGSNIAADNLEGVMHDARKMAAELKLINETSDGLASRLEKLAEKNRKIAEGMTPTHFSAYEDPDYPAQSYRTAEAANVDSPAFTIVDRGDEEETEYWQDENQSFSSEAEKDLYRALQKNKKKTERKW